MSVVADGIHVRLAGRAVLSGVSLECRVGRITGVIGPNGAGKTTLIRALAGLVPVVEGEITLDGTRLTELPAALRGLRLAYLPQDRLVHWPLSVRRVVALGRLPHRFVETINAATRGEEIVDQALEAMNVTHLAERPASELSGGELARVLIARAVAQEASIILADEPTAGLDPAHALALFDVLERLATVGRTVVLALHDLSLAARFCHEVVLLAGGRVVATGPPAETMTEEALATVFGVRMAIGEVGGVPAIVPLPRDPGHLLLPRRAAAPPL
jgi:iron complex transport system ATP-binding protein